MKTPTSAEIIHIPVALILTSYPQVSQVFIRNRMGCIGCPFSRFHTLIDVVEIYQLDKETFLGDIQDLLSSRDVSDPSKVVFD
jgi:hybrid cluster-associated redox disulfide protein